MYKVGGLLTAGAMMLVCFGNAHGISKMNWLNQMRQQVGPKLCQMYYADPKTAALMRQHHISLARCRTEITTIFQRCANTYINNMPTQIDGQSGKYWGERLGVCTAAGFQDEFMTSKVNKNTLRERLKQVNVEQFCASRYFAPVLASQHLTQAQCMQSMTMNKAACITQTLNSLPQMVKPYKASNAFMQCLINKL